MNFKSIQLFPADERSVALDATGFNRDGWIYRGSVDEPESIALNKIVALSVDTSLEVTRHEVLEYLVKEQDRFASLGMKMWSELNKARGILTSMNKTLLHTSARFILAAGLERVADHRRDLLTFRYIVKHRGYKWSPSCGDAPVEHGNDYFVAFEA